MRARSVRAVIGAALAALLAMSGAGAQETAREPEIPADCGEQDLSTDPYELERSGAQHVPALDICAGWIDATWDVESSTLTDLELTIDLAGRVAERPPLSWYRFSLTYDAPEPDRACRLDVELYDRVEGVNAGAESVWVLRTCYDVPKEFTPLVDYLTGTRTTTQDFFDLDVSAMRAEASRLSFLLPADGELSWMAEHLTAGVALRNLAVSTGIHGNVPYRAPLPVFIDYATASGATLRP